MKGPLLVSETYGNVVPLHRCSVRLTWGEVVLAANIGTMRRIKALQDGRRHRWGVKRAADWDWAIHGALGEQALAKHTNNYWPPQIGVVGAVDVGDNLQARAKTIPGDRLVVHPDDHDRHIFVSVLLDLPNAYLCGWLWGHEAKLPQYWTDPGTGRPAYFIPDADLHPMDELP